MKLGYKDVSVILSYQHDGCTVGTPLILTQMLRVNVIYACDLLPADGCE